MVKDSNLLKRVGALGFQLFEPEKSGDANLALADVVKSRDLRLWEGFSVVLANSASSSVFDYKEVKSYLKKAKDKANFMKLFALSLALYKAAGLGLGWADTLHKLLSSSAKKEFNSYYSSLKKGDDFKLGGYTMSSVRLKKTFSDYFTRSSGPRLNDLLLEKEELGLEYALSQVFSPKQKDLFLKRLKGEKLTKTEKEYFSRAVKKKVLALANADLHRLAHKILE